jgi:2-haloacid dehalogenase
LGTDSRYGAVLFDLFSALLDSGALWSEVAGSAELGARWREESSRVAYSAGSYRPFAETVAEAARSPAFHRSGLRICFGE